MSSTPEPDPALLDARDLAVAALHEITAAASIGPAAGYRLEADGVVSLRFENRLGGYPGWYWTVSVARVDGAEPTVLEAELLPGDGALLAPDWVPWAERLADYQAAQAAAAEAEAAAEEAAATDDGQPGGEDELAGDELDDVDDLDESDFDPDGSPILHAGDVDGVDIDELDDQAADDEDEDDDESDDDDDDDLDDDDESDADDDDESDVDDDDDIDDESDDDEFDDSDESDDDGESGVGDESPSDEDDDLG